jgi:hypothetical protein
MNATKMQYRAAWMVGGSWTYGEWRDSYEQANDDMFDMCPAKYQHRNVQNSESAADPEGAAFRALNALADNAQDFARAMGIR